MRTSLVARNKRKGEKNEREEKRERDVLLVDLCVAFFKQRKRRESTEMYVDNSTLSNIWLLPSSLYRSLLCSSCLASLFTYYIFFFILLLIYKKTSYILICTDFKWEYINRTSYKVKYEWSTTFLSSPAATTTTTTYKTNIW